MTQPQRWISRLRLTGFRNYQSAGLDLDSRHVVLVGENGSGKTNLLEAVSLFSPGRGLRRAPFESLATLGGDGQWAVATTLESPFGPTDIGTGAAPDGQSRRVRINGAPARAIDDMSGHLRVLWLTPAMDGLFSGPGADRRRFFDRLVTTLIPGHSETVGDFDKAMRQRNRLLETGGDALWLDALEAQMAQAASAIHFARADSLARLRAEMRAGIAETGFPEARLDVAPILGDGVPETASGLEEVLIARWRESRPRDRAAGRTLEGPHRADLAVTHAAKDMPAGLCSTGEQKALLIGLVLVHARLTTHMTGITPLLLLDEIAAHLDPGRRAALYRALERLGTQCWMTGTDPMLFTALGGGAQRYLVAGGRLSPAMA